MGIGLGREQKEIIMLGLLNHSQETNSGLFSLQRTLLPDVNSREVMMLRDHVVHGQELTILLVWKAKKKKKKGKKETKKLLGQFLSC